MASPKIKKLRINLTIWKSVLGLISREPKILLPYVFLAAIESLVLYLLASSPHYPVNLVLAQPIRNIWGEVYLHYPYIYNLLPRIFYYANIVVGIFIGSVTSGMAVLMVYTLQKKQTVDLKAVFFSVLKRYVSLFFLTLILFACVHFLMKQPHILTIKLLSLGHGKLLFLGPVFWLKYALPVINFLLAVVLQGLFVYSIPYIVIRGKKFLYSLIAGIGLFFKTIVKTLLVVIVPMLFYIPVTMLKNNLGFLENKFFPEITVLVLFAGVLVGTILVDSLVTMATTLLFLEETHEK